MTLDDAADEACPVGKRVILEKHHGCEYLREAIHGQKDIAGGDEVFKENVWPGHFGTKNIQHRLTSPAHASRVHPHHHCAANGANRDKNGQYFKNCFHRYKDSNVCPFLSIFVRRMIQ